MTPLSLSLSDQVNYGVIERNGKAKGTLIFEGEMLNSGIS